MLRSFPERPVRLVWQVEGRSPSRITSFTYHAIVRTHWWIRRVTVWLVVRGMYINYHVARARAYAYIYICTVQLNNITCGTAYLAKCLLQHLVSVYCNYVFIHIGNAMHECQQKTTTTRKLQCSEYVHAYVKLYAFNHKHALASSCSQLCTRNTQINDDGWGINTACTCLPGW